MGVLNKAKIAAKRQAVKGVKRAIRELSSEPLEEVKPIVQDLIHGNISRVSQSTKASVSTRTVETQTPAVRILPVQARVVNPQHLVDAINQRRAERLARRRAASHAAKLNPEDYGSINQLRQLLGLPPPFSSSNTSNAPASPQDALLVSLDTEWERHGLVDHVVEIGLTTLDTRDIAHTPPGPAAHAWLAKAKTYHYVLDTTRRPADRMRACYFSDDMFGAAASIKHDLLSILQRAAHPPFDPAKPIPTGARRVVLVGHSLAKDLHHLHRTPALHLNLLSPATLPTKPSRVFDTLLLADAAMQRGAALGSAKLGRLANRLGVHPQYRAGDAVIGSHNAGNDAAYAMMVAVLFAVRWEEIVPGEVGAAEEEERSDVLGERAVVPVRRWKSARVARRRMPGVRKGLVARGAGLRVGVGGAGAARRR